MRRERPGAPLRTAAPAPMARHVLAGDASKECISRHFPYLDRASTSKIELVAVWRITSSEGSFIGTQSRTLVAKLTSLTEQE